MILSCTKFVIGPPLNLTINFFAHGIFLDPGVISMKNIQKIAVVDPDFFISKVLFNALATLYYKCRDRKRLSL